MSNIRAFTLSSRTVIVIIDIVFRYFHLECFFFILRNLDWISTRRNDEFLFYPISFFFFFFFLSPSFDGEKNRKRAYCPREGFVKMFCQAITIKFLIIQI